MRVLLISPNLFHEPHPVYPLGLDYVAGAIGDRHAVRLVDLNESPRETLSGHIRDFAPEAVGLSLRNVDNVDATDCRSFVTTYRDIAADLKGLTKAPLILGGSGFTIFPAAFMKELDADYGIVGEGERLSPLLLALEERRDGSGLPGVMARGDRSVVFPPPWEGPIRRLSGGRTERHGFYLKRSGILNLQTKRGCPFRCSYCTYPHIDGRKLRLFDSSAVAAEARRLQDLGARFLFVTDTTFNNDVEHSLRVARSFREAGLTVPWGAFFAPLAVPDDYFARLTAAGLTHVEFGTESLSEKMLLSYRKPFTVPQALKAHEQARAAGLHVAHYFLLGGPGEDRASVMETLAQAERLEKAVRFFFCGIRLYPYTALHEQARREQGVPAGTDLLAPLFYRAGDFPAERTAQWVKERAAGRRDWVVGSDAAAAGRILSRLYARGHSGPLWELLAS